MLADHLPQPPLEAGLHEGVGLLTLLEGQAHLGQHLPPTAHSGTVPELHLGANVGAVHHGIPQAGVAEEVEAILVVLGQDLAILRQGELGVWAGVGVGQAGAVEEFGVGRAGGTVDVVIGVDSADVTAQILGEGGIPRLVDPAVQVGVGDADAGQPEKITDGGVAKLGGQEGVGHPTDGRGVVRSGGVVDADARSSFLAELGDTDGRLLFLIAVLLVVGGVQLPTVGGEGIIVGGILTPVTTSSTISITIAGTLCLASLLPSTIGIVIIIILVVVIIILVLVEGIVVLIGIVVLLLLLVITITILLLLWLLPSLTLHIPVVIELHLGIAALGILLSQVFRFLLFFVGGGIIITVLIGRDLLPTQIVTVGRDVVVPRPIVEQYHRPGRMDVGQMVRTVRVQHVQAGGRWQEGWLLLFGILGVDIQVILIIGMVVITIRGTLLDAIGTVQPGQVAVGTEIEQDDGPNVTGSSTGGHVVVLALKCVAVIVVIMVTVETVQSSIAAAVLATAAMVQGRPDPAVARQLGQDADQLAVAAAGAELVRDAVGAEGVRDDPGGGEGVDVGIDQEEDGAARGGAELAAKRKREGERG